MKAVSTIAPSTPIVEDKHKEYATGLRLVADFIEQHPELPLPPTEFSNYSLNTKEEAEKLMRALGTCEKVYTDQMFYLVKKFGALTYRGVFFRDEVCTRIQVGEKLVPEHHLPARDAETIAEHMEPVYEWRCPGSVLNESK